MAYCRPRALPKIASSDKKTVSEMYPIPRQFLIGEEIQIGPFVDSSLQRCKTIELY